MMLLDERRKTVGREAEDNTLTIRLVTLGPLLSEIRFLEKFREYDPLEVLCLDGLGRVCDTDEDFRRARKDHAFPIRAYRRHCPVSGS